MVRNNVHQELDISAFGLQSIRSLLRTRDHCFTCWSITYCSTVCLTTCITFLSHYLDFLWQISALPMSYDDFKKENEKHLVTLVPLIGVLMISSLLQVIWSYHTSIFDACTCITYVTLITQLLISNIELLDSSLYKLPPKNATQIYHYFMPA